MKAQLRTSVTILSVLAATSAFAADAESDWFASLYTGEGIELRADERVFTLYALLNAMGYDDGPKAREFPLPRYQFHPVRQQVRTKLLSGAPEIRDQANAFFDGHAKPISHYLQYALHSAPPPFSSGAKAKELQDLKGLEALLKNTWTQWKLDDLMAQVQGDYRKGLRAWLTAVDEPMTKARKLLAIPANGPQSMLVLNMLEAENRITGVMGDGEVVLVVGPTAKPDVQALVTEYARVFIEPKVASKAQGGWGGGATLLREAQLLGAKENTVGEYATALFTQAVALKATNAPDSAYDALAQKGYYGVKDIAQQLEEGKPVDGWALDALRKAETRRPAKK